MRLLSSNSWKVKSGEYLAPVGQILQVSQRMHLARPRYGCDNFATGFGQKGIPDFSPHSLSWVRLYDSGRGGSGYGFDRISRSNNPRTPATPMRSSAS